MSSPDRLSQERRARLAAERLLELKQAELFSANKKLNQHALALSHEINETRAEVAEVRQENQKVMVQLGQANEKIELVEGQLWKALETIHDGFAMFNEERQLELANPAYMAAFDGLDSIRPGASFHHILTMMVEEGIVDLQGEDGEAWCARMEARWDADEIPTETIRLWNGHFIKLQDRHTPDGGIVSLCIDTTELMRMWSAVDQLPDGFVMYDPEDRLLMCNEPYRNIYSASAPVIKPGAQFEDILRYGLEHGQYADALGREDAWLEERMQIHRTAEIEVEQLLDDGRWIRVYERRTHDGGRVGLRIDISQIKRDQVALEAAMVRAEAANRAKSAFLANMSHEIRTPMNGVVGMADLMMETDLSEEQKMFVETIRSSGEALLVIINDILDYSKIESDKLVLHTESFDLEQAIHEVVRLLQPTARDKALRLMVDYDMFLPTVFIGDPGRIRQILTNLMGNAVKFTEEGHVLVRVVGVPQDDGSTSVHLTVEDTGIGIPEDKVEHVFGEFNQVEDERNRSFEGTGLGLSITRKLVELMGGEVWVTSTLGVGSCFGIRLVLPMVKENAPPQELGTTGEPQTALVVDANDTNREILSKQLSSQGVQVNAVPSGTEALAGTNADLAIIDEELPDMSGAEVAEALGARRGGPRLILMSSRLGSSETKPDGVEQVLQKPPTRAALRSVIETPPTPPVLFRHRSVETPQPDVAPLPAPADPPPPKAMPSAATLDVLLAEDNKTNQLVFKKMVKDLPLTLRFAENGLEALTQFEAQRPDVIFMDISMPKMDGKEAAKAIRGLEAPHEHVPIIAVTAHAMDGDREAILAAGLDDYLTKPLRKAALSEKLAPYLEQLETSEAEAS